MARKKRTAANKQAAAPAPPDEADPPAEADATADAKVDPEWAAHPAREVLKNAFYAKEIPLNYKAPQDIYDHFADHEAFAGMPYDDKFTRRLRDLRDIVEIKMNAIIIDKTAYDLFRQKFPVREVNDVGLLRWNGSMAEYYLKLDMQAGLHVGKTPLKFRDSRPEYKLFSKKRFRKHINQEQRLGKLHNFLGDKQQKAEEKKAKKAAKMKKKAEAEKKKIDEEATKMAAAIAAKEKSKAAAAAKKVPTKKGRGRKKQTGSDN
jgi:hypothetical protein